jgi:hypothetical protein
MWHGSTHRLRPLVDSTATRRLYGYASTLRLRVDSKATCRLYGYAPTLRLRVDSKATCRSSASKKCDAGYSFASSGAHAASRRLFRR